MTKKLSCFRPVTFSALHAGRPGLLELSSKAMNLSELLNDFLSEGTKNRKSSKTPKNKTTRQETPHIFSGTETQNRRVQRRWARSNTRQQYVQVSQEIIKYDIKIT